MPLLFIACGSTALERIVPSEDGSGFVLAYSGKKFVAWGFNYDHDHDGRLIEDYWIDEWPTVVEDFYEMKALGANTVRIHLQFGKFVKAPGELDRNALAQLGRLVALAEEVGLYLDITGLGCYHKQDVPAWYDALDETERWEQQALFWEGVAKVCASSPAIFCYDLMNEPILPGRNETETDWLAGAFDGKYFVQRIALDLDGRIRLEVARDWVDRLVDAIRKHDPDHMVTVGVIPWALTFPGAKPIFYSREAGSRLDFVSVHFYPEKNAVDKALDALAVYEVGKPLIVEEMFPLKCSSEEMVEFIDASRDSADGFISFYWGRTPAEYAASDSGLAGAIIKSWIETFCRERHRISQEKTNIVLIMADDLGFECLRCCGGTDYETPNLDRLAEQGIRFDHCYSQPVCTPSRVQIMTGRYNQRNYDGFGYLDPREITFGNLLRDAGYATCIAGKWQLSGDASTVKGFGFDEHCLWNMHAYKGDGPDAEERSGWRKRYATPALYVNGSWREPENGDYGPDLCCDFACSFLERNREKPFFLYYPMILPHDPFVPTPDSTNQEEKDKKKNFGDMVSHVDKLVGRIADRLEELGLAERTLLLFTADNGTHRAIESRTTTGVVKGGKSIATDAGTHVPLIASWPGTAPRGVVCGDLIDFSDFLPTLAELAGAGVPRDRVIDGRSFLPQLRGLKGAPREWIFCHYWKRGREKDKLTEYVRGKLFKLYGDGRLFDVSADPLEKNPLEALSDDAATAKISLEKGFDAVRSR